MKFRAGVIGFVVGGVLAVGTAFALAGPDNSTSGEAPNDAQVSAEALQAFKTGEFAVPDPDQVTPVSEPNRVGAMSDEFAASCVKVEAASGGKAADPAAGEVPPLTPGAVSAPDPTSCALIKAVDQGLVKEGQELSNEELQRVLEEVEGR